MRDELEEIVSDGELICEDPRDILDRILDRLIELDPKVPATKMLFLRDTLEAVKRGDL